MLYKTDPHKSGNSDSKPKVEVKKDPLMFQKSKTYIWRPQIKKFYKTDPPKIGNSDSKYHFEIFKNQKTNSKKTPLSSKKLKTYIRRPQIKKFYKTDPPKMVILIQNTISKFSKIKLKKDHLKFQKIKKHI